VSWFRRKPAAPAIPPYQPPIEVKPQPKSEPGILVEEIDTSDMTKTGVFRTWNRLTGQLTKPE
jgi:hypothetical protein